MVKGMTKPSTMVLEAASKRMMKHKMASKQLRSGTERTEKAKLSKAAVKSKLRQIKTK